MPLLAVEGAKIKQLDLIDLMAAEASRAKKAAFETRRTDQGGIEVMLGKPTAIGTTPVLLAQFQITGGQHDSIGVKRSARTQGGQRSRDQLRDCVLKITTEKGGIRYAILRRKPNVIPDSLKLRTSPSGKNSKRSEVSYAPLPKKVRRPIRTVKWEPEGSYKGFRKYLVIKSLSMKVQGGDTQPARVREGKAVYDRDGTLLMEVRLDDNSGEMIFQFDRNPYDMSESDASVVANFLDASYNVVIGLDIEGQVVEFARIGSFPSNEPSRVRRDRRTMADYHQIVDQIRGFLQSSDQTRNPRLEGLASDFAAACIEVNQRLAGASGWCSRGCAPRRSSSPNRSRGCSTR